MLPHRMPICSTSWPTPPHRNRSLPSITTGELIAIADEGQTPLVRFAGQHGSAALRAHTVVDLHDAHIRLPVALMVENGDPALPLVMGVLRQAEGWPLAQTPAQVEIDVNGARRIVSAKQQLVLRCGKASITLTKAGKVLIKGAYVESRAEGVNQLGGGEIRLN